MTGQYCQGGGRTGTALQVRCNIINVVQNANFLAFWIALYNTVGACDTESILPVVRRAHLDIEAGSGPRSLLHRRLVQLPVPMIGVMGVR
jgi:hypothetical protein